jgi:hypothetical protein
VSGRKSSLETWQRSNSVSILGSQGDGDSHKGNNKSKEEVVHFFPIKIEDEK